MSRDGPADEAAYFAAKIRPGRVGDRLPGCVDIIASDVQLTAWVEQEPNLVLVWPYELDFMDEKLRRRSANSSLASRSGGFVTAAFANSRTSFP